MANSNSFDLTIAYRIYPGVSKIPFIYPKDKIKLAEIGVKTLKQSLVNYRAKIFFLLDNCPSEYATMILKYFQESDISIIYYQGIGNLATFGKQIDLLLEQVDSEIIMFAEDDYVYRKNELGKAVRLLKTNPDIDFVTPYDHLDSYILPIHTKHRYEIVAKEGLHWRTSASTCLTFLTKKSTLKRSEQVFRTYCNGNWDSSLWFALTKFNVLDIRSLYLVFKDWFLFKTILKSWITCGGQILFGKKYKLWQSMPSIATHMEKISLAPTINWEKVVKDSYSEN
jgi:ribosomal protein L30E